jgi:hypothetical protein
MNNLNEEQVKMLKNMGALAYQPSKIASIMGFSISDVSTAMDDVSSEFHKIYTSGSNMANYLIDLKLFEMAQSGDIKAMDKLSERKKLMRIEEQKLQ